MVYIIMKLINKTLINILIHKRQIPFPYYSRKSFRGIRLSFFSQCHTKHKERVLKIKFIEKNVQMITLAQTNFYTKSGKGLIA